MQFLPTLCASCRFLKGRNCAAFPRGIPDEIFVWGGPHTEATPEQKNNVAWELKDGKEEEFEQWRAFVTATPA